MPNHYGDKKTGKAVLDGEVVKFKEGGLRNNDFNIAKYYSELIIL